VVRTLIKHSKLGPEQLSFCELVAPGLPSANSGSGIGSGVRRDRKREKKATLIKDETNALRLNQPRKTGIRAVRNPTQAPLLPLASRSLVTPSLLESTSHTVAIALPSQSDSHPGENTDDVFLKAIVDRSGCTNA